MAIFDSPNAGKPLASGLAPGQFRMWRVRYTFREDDWAVWALLGAERPKPIRGYGGHGQLARPGRRAVSAFEGSDTPAYSVVLRLDRRRPQSAPVKDQMRNLEKLAGWNLANDTPPPRVRWIANVAHDYSEARQNEWAVETLEWGDSVASDRGTLLWQDATLTLGLQTDAEVPELGRARGFAHKTLRKGETLRGFARRVLGDASRWKDVASLNRDNPRCPQTAEHKVGRSVDLLIPPREPKPRKARGRN